MPANRLAKLPQLLDDYREARKERLQDAPKGVQNAAQLVLCSLQKRLLSSIEAFASTLRAPQSVREGRHVCGDEPSGSSDPGR